MPTTTPRQKLNSKMLAYKLDFDPFATQLPSYRSYRNSLKWCIFKYKISCNITNPQNHKPSISNLQPDIIPIDCQRGEIRPLNKTVFSSTLPNGI